jgi:hypothetical protein
MAFTLAQLEHLFCCWTGGDGGDDDMFDNAAIAPESQATCRDQLGGKVVGFVLNPQVLWAKRCLKRTEIKSPTWNSNHQSNHSQATNHRFLDKSLAGLRHNFLLSVSIVDC